MIRLVGDPILTQVIRVFMCDLIAWLIEFSQVAKTVRIPPTPAVLAASRELESALVAFRREKGFGRAIAAPQIGLSMRMVAATIAGRTFTLLNPLLFGFSGAESEFLNLSKALYCLYYSLVSQRRNLRYLMIA